MEITPSDLNQTLLERLVTHVVLPRDISNKILKEHDRVNLMLIERMTKTIEDSSDWIPDRVVSTFRRFKRVNINRSPEFVSQQINELEPGGIFAMLVRNQRCVFMIHRSKRDDEPSNSSDLSDSDSAITSVDLKSQGQCSDETEMVTIASFTSAVDPKEIYSHSMSDLQVNLLISVKRQRTGDTNAFIFFAVDLPISGTESSLFGFDPI